jgi:type I restriction enzyme, S subunit
MSVRLRQLVTVNPPTPQFDRLRDDAEVPFLPPEAVWPGDHFDPSRRRRKGDVSVGYTRFIEGDILLPKITPTFQADEPA